MRSAMRIAGADKAVGNVLAWILRQEWAENWAEVLADHLGPACDDLGIEAAELEAALGPDGHSVVFVGAVGDFLSRSFGDGRGQARTMVRTAAQLDPSRLRLAETGPRQRRHQNTRRRMILPDNDIDKHPRLTAVGSPVLEKTSSI